MGNMENRKKAVLIQHSPSLERAIHFAYDVGKRIMGENVEILEHLNSRFGHVFVVGETSKEGKQEQKHE